MYHPGRTLIRKTQEKVPFILFFIRLPCLFCHSNLFHYFFPIMGDAAPVSQLEATMALEQVANAIASPSSASPGVSESCEGRGVWIFFNFLRRIIEERCILVRSLGRKETFAGHAPKE